MAACSLAACQPPALTRSRPGAAPDLAALSRYGTEVRGLSAEQLEAQYRALVAQSAADPSPETRIKLSLLLSDPAAPFVDTGQALRLLGDVMVREGTAESADAEFASLLYYLLSERSCVDLRRATLAQMLTSERERAARLGTELRETREDLDSERAHRRTLERQLAALKSLEERISTGGDRSPEGD
jgi:hypothetical protein